MKLCLGLNLKLSGSFNHSSGKQVCVSAEPPKLVCSTKFTLFPPLSSHLGDIRFTVQVVLAHENWEDTKMA